MPKPKRKLRESIADRPSINHQIERVLAKHDRGTQTRLLDALETVKNAGEAGISVADWADAVRRLHPDGDFSMKDLLKTAASDFGCCVQRIGDKLYGWREDDGSTDTSGATPQMRAAVSSQIALTHAAMNMMKQMGEFTVNDLTTRLARATGMDELQAEMFVTHLLSQFVGGTLERIGPNHYRVKALARKTANDHLNDLKDIARRPNPDA